MSIEAKHRDKIKELNEINEVVKLIQASVDELLRRKAETTDVFESLALDDKIFEEKKRIQELSSLNHNDYFLKVSGILNEYYKASDNVFSQLANPVSVNGGTMFGFVEQKTNNRRGQLFNEYMHLMNNEPIPSQSHNQNLDTSRDVFECSECKNKMKLSVNESYIVCDSCGNFETYFEPSVSGLTYEQEINTNTNIHFAYKRINHLRELLAQLQAKESSEIPEAILHAVRVEFMKSRIKDMSEITQEKVKYYLKKLNLNKYYEHTRQITNILSGKPPPYISNELYEKLINMFTDIQEPFERVCPKNRKNFFSYNYILYKFCELLGENEIKALFPLLKSREKLYQQDCIWKNICTIMGWTFHKSV